MNLSFLSIAYLLPLTMSFGATVGVGLYSTRRRTVPGALCFAVFNFWTASYTFGYVFVLLSPGLNG
jgi:hypothetical protein